MESSAIELILEVFDGGGGGLRFEFGYGCAAQASKYQFTFKDNFGY